MAWLHIQYHSEVLGMPVPMEVLLPQYGEGDHRMVNHKGPYQTLYLLHGMSDDHTSWMRRTSIERYVNGKPLAVVMPAGHRGWYTDMAYGKKYLTFITQELPTICERMFPLSAKREDRFIAGLSMGGYGAMKAGVIACETFSAAASFSGALDSVEIFDYLDEKEARDIFGTKEHLLHSHDNLFKATEQLKKDNKPIPQIYMWCGTEDFLYEQNIRFKEHLKNLGIPFTYEEGPGDHSWGYWDVCIQRLFEWLPLLKVNTEVGGE